MANGMPWVKLYTEIIDDPKLGRLNDSLKWRFVSLIALAGECDAEGCLVNGHAPLSVEELAWRLRLDPARMAEDVAVLVEAGLLEWDGESGALWVTNFAERQGRSQDEKRTAWRLRKQVQRSGLREIVYERAGGCCEYCGAALEQDKYVVDHVVPAGCGGTNDLDNLACSCVSCNTKKAGRTPEDARMPDPRDKRKAGTEAGTEKSVPTLSQPCPNLVTVLEKEGEGEILPAGAPVRAGRSPPEAQTEEPKQTNTQRRQAIFAALARICKLDPELKRGRLNKSTARIFRTQYNAVDLDTAKTWWYRHDWRGKKGQVPTPEQLEEVLPQALADPGDGLDLDRYTTGEYADLFGGIDA